MFASPTATTRGLTAGSTIIAPAIIAERSLGPCQTPADDRCGGLALGQLSGRSPRIPTAPLAPAALWRPAVAPDGPPAAAPPARPQAPARMAFHHVGAAADDELAARRSVSATSDSKEK